MSDSRLSNIGHSLGGGNVVPEVVPALLHARNRDGKEKEMKHAYKLKDLSITHQSRHNHYGVA